MTKSRFRKAVGALLAGAIIGGLALIASPAQAIVGAPGPTPRTGPNTEIVNTGTAEGQTVTGFVPPGAATSDPSVAYPTTPPASHTSPVQGFAGIITAASTDGSTQLQMYCIDILTTTYPGIGYINGSWEESGMPNLGFVARLLNEYFPNSGEPAAAPDDNVRAAAVQAAIWYFTDNFVLAAGDAVRPYTEAIVNAVRTQPPLPSPTPPSLAITPPESTATVGTAAGPFTVETDAAGGAAVTATGGTLYADAAATDPVPDGTVVLDGGQLWVLPDDPAPGATVTIDARGEATMPSGNVYLYDGNTAGVSDAQRLILAQTVTVSTSVTAVAAFEAQQLGALTVSKAFAGPAAGAQGAVTLHVSCTNGLEQDIAIDAGATATVDTTISDLPLGTECEVSEPGDGSDGLVVVRAEGLGTVTIAAATNAITVTNTVTEELAVSGSPMTWWPAAVAIVLLALGTVMLVLRSRRGRSERSEREQE